MGSSSGGWGGGQGGGSTGGDGTGASRGGDSGDRIYIFLIDDQAEFLYSARLPVGLEILAFQRACYSQFNP